MYFGLFKFSDKSAVLSRGMAPLLGFLLILSCNPEHGCECNVRESHQAKAEEHPDCINTRVALQVQPDTARNKIVARVSRGGTQPFVFVWSCGERDTTAKQSEITGKKNGWYAVTVADHSGDSTVERIWFGDALPDESVSDKEGNVYATIRIGEQLWMAENLKTNLPDSWCYNNEEENCGIYGRLYTWYTALNACPAGWHLPTDAEWKTLEVELGMQEDELDENGLRGTTEGGKIKSSSMLWHCPNQEASNVSGFSALPGGPRYKFGMFGLLGHNATWWTATEYDENYAWFRYVGHSHAKIGRIDNEKIGGHSIRCVKD